MDNNDIDVNPEYQRDVVWTAERMAQLVDSLMENYYIPPIIFNRKENTLVCVDGKQRLSSIRAFVKGMIWCQDYRGEKWWFTDSLSSGEKRKKNILSDDARQAFLEKDFVTFEYVNLQSDQEEDLFARVQMGMPLSAAEKLRAQKGPWQELGKVFVRDFPTIYALLKDTSRGKDFQLTLSCFCQIMEVKHPSHVNGSPLSKTTHTMLPKFLKGTEAVEEDTKSHLANVWMLFQDLIELDPNVFTNADKYLKGVQTFAPVEMLAVVVLLSVHSDVRDRNQLLNDIRRMRILLRDIHKDLRMNAYTWKDIWSYVESLKDQGASGRNSESVAPAPTPPVLDESESRPRKRKRNSQPTSRPSQAVALSPEEMALRPAPSAGPVNQETTSHSSPPVKQEPTSLTFAPTSTSVSDPAVVAKPERQQSENTASPRRSNQQLKTPASSSFAAVNTYRAPTAPMGPGPSAGPSAPTAKPSFARAPESFARPRGTQKTAPKSRTKQPTTSSPAKAKLKARPSTTSTDKRWVLVPQQHGIIDLTSDDEHEEHEHEEQRASLLSAFQKS